MDKRHMFLIGIQKSASFDYLFCYLLYLTLLYFYLADGNAETQILFT